ncbi:hypothetical protein [Sphingomonas sp. Leaf62]|uniref:hypothetical protein n=1 Tax=Sphingomonas sp. Leaf62 TaxID=1736228 RepID=UPI0006F6B020|nr:hypothetical protein [Sphingomonas sp. Leaf62]KQN71836.1 hypothetical protein ASE91_03785 [Sphingomonas sp. Leaf62]
MTGPQKAVAIIALAVIAVGWFNWRMWRRFRAAKAYRGGWSEADFDTMVAGNGVSLAVAAAVRVAVSHLYGSGVVPHPDDDFLRFLGVDPEDLGKFVSDAAFLLNLPILGSEDPDQVSALHDLRDLAQYMQAKVDAGI